MCGIAGIIKKNQSTDADLMKEMLASIAHRGPEDEGIWMSKNHHVALGQRRLAIVDLSPLGHQPMISADGRYVITFNGEIYNYPELKAELEGLGRTFISQSDTEALLYSYVQWGEKCLEKLNGMFAFAVWDEKEQKLFAARDRLGEKPFKYHYDGENLSFASEIKALLVDSSLKREIDWPAIDIAMAYRFVPSPLTGFKDIRKLPAGHYLTWQDGAIAIKKYWDPETIKIDRNKSLADWKDEVWRLFADSVKKRLMSDVPIGAFLSGGIDSTSVVAALHELNHPLNTYVISVGGKSADSEYAALAAKYFKTNHKHIELTADHLDAAVKGLVDYYDEPFFDASALPSRLISQVMKKEVTVVLSGDGGDEIFGGYGAYRLAQKLPQIKRMLPKFFSALVPAIKYISPKAAYRLEILLKDFYAAYSDYFAVWQSALPKTKKYLTRDDLYSPDIKNKIRPDGAATLMEQWFGHSGERANDAMIADLHGRLPDGYMAKTDFATMSAALEIRPPFLDYRLVELCASMPEKYKIRNGRGKWIWKEIIKDKIPAEIIYRPKAGFSIPLDAILKNELKPLAEEILLGESIVKNYFSPDIMKQLWQDHIKGQADYSNHIWSIIMLELWLKKYVAR